MPCSIIPVPVTLLTLVLEIDVILGNLKSKVLGDLLAMLKLLSLLLDLPSVSSDLRA